MVTNKILYRHIGVYPSTELQISFFKEKQSVLLSLDIISNYCQPATTNNLSEVGSA